MSLTPGTVSLSHDGSTWVDVSQWVDGELSWRNGRSVALGEWQTGTADLALLSKNREIDPLNDAATFQPREGDYIKIADSVGTAFLGRVEGVSGTLERTALYPIMRASLRCTDGLARLTQATLYDIGQINATWFAGTHIAIVLAFVTLDYGATTAIDAGDVPMGLPGAESGAVNALALMQQITRTEGGASALFCSRAGTLTWLERSHRPGTVVQFGSGGVKISDVKFAIAEADWANVANVTPAAHVTEGDTSSTSVTCGTGTKSFTLDALSANDGWGLSAGAGVYIESSGSPTNNMTGTVTSFDETTRALVCSITSKGAGSSTRTDWGFTFTELAEVQTAIDDQTASKFGLLKGKDYATYHGSRTAAAAAARLLAAERAFAPHRVSSFTVNLATCSPSEKTAVLGLGVGDAADVKLVLSASDTLRQIRQIDGVARRSIGLQSTVTFTLGRSSTVNLTSVTLKQGAVTPTQTTNEALFSVVDSWCRGHIKITAGSAGSAGAEIQVTPVGLPSPLATTQAVGTWFYNDAGTSGYAGVVEWDGAVLRFRVHNSTTYLGATPSFTVANTDFIDITLKPFPVV